MYEVAVLTTTSQSNDPEKPISAGFFRLDKGTPLNYEYTFDEMKIILEGEFAILDESGQTVHAKRGDVFYFPKGSKITFATETGGLAFFVGSLLYTGGGFTDTGRRDNGPRYKLLFLYPE